MNNINSKTSFEEALKKLEDTIKVLDEGDLTLEESLNEFKNGIDMYKHCNEILNDIEGKIELILEDKDGNITWNKKIHRYNRK